MSYAFNHEETLEDGVRRIALELLDDSREQLSDPGDKLEDAVHTSRKNFKKMRALIRLIRDTLGKKTYKKENVFFRNLGRELAPVRDAHVLIDTLQDLKNYCTDEWVVDNISVIRWEMEKTLNDKHLDDGEIEKRLENVRNGLDESYQRIASWPEIPHAFNSLSNGLERVYRRGYNGFHKSYENPDTDTLHDWRKRVKYLWYHTRLTNIYWPVMLEPYGEELHHLADLLGDDHDLAILKQALLKEDIPFTLREPVSRLLSCLNRRRQYLQEHAFIVAQRIYAHEPASFITWYQAMWNAYQKLDSRQMESENPGHENSADAG